MLLRDWKQAFCLSIALSCLSMMPAVLADNLDTDDAPSPEPAAPVTPGLIEPMTPGYQQSSAGSSLDDLRHRLEQLEYQNSVLTQQIHASPTYRPMTVNKVFQPYLRTPKKTGFFGRAEYLRWAYRQPGLEYAISDIGGVQDRGAVGTVLALDGKYDNGLRVALGYRFDASDCCGFCNRPELLFTYTQFGTELEDIRAVPVRSTFISADNTENNDSDDINTLGVETITPDDRATAVTARMTFDYDVYDLEFAQSLALTRTLTWRVSAGARAAVMNEHYDVTYTGGDFQNPFTSRRDWDYSGGGILFGSDLNWSVRKNFGITFGAKTGAVLGRYQSRTFIPDDEPGVPTDVRSGTTRVNPFIEVNAGVQYQRPIGNAILTVGAGYEIVNWFNMAENRTFTDSHQEGMNVKTLQDVSLDGFYSRVGINY